MKKLFMTGGVLGLLIGLLWLLTLSNASVPASPIEAPPTLEFARFPLDKKVAIDFDAEVSELGALSAREQRDQALDWLLLAAIADAGMSPADLNLATFDLPPVRRGYLQPVADFEYGPSRSRIIPGNRVLALIPATASAGERAHHLMAVFDQQRKNLGEVPLQIVPFEYELDLKKQTATLARRNPVAGKALLSLAYGYQEVAVGTLEQLQGFLGQTNDVVYAALRDGHLIVGGRKLAPRQYTGLSTEDVATLWQSEQAVGEKKAAFERKWQDEVDRLEKRFRAMSSPSQAEFDAEVQQIQQRAAQDQRAQGVVSHSGFSLDPAFDDEGMERAVEKSRVWLLAISSTSGHPLPAQEFDNLVQALRHKDGSELNRLRQEGALGPALERELVKLSETHTFQRARYDGELAGTNVGMTLFYTDLLAKLWALDFHGHASEGVIADFKPLTQVTFSPVFSRETEEHNETRLWFGHRDKGMQIGANGNSLLFARNATRVYAASINVLNPGEESPPNEPSEQFLGWWDDHYEEIAEFEHQYERLNQIMKWSAILGWLNAQRQGETLKFLSEVPVDRHNWFPTWVKRQAGLRYSDWSSVPFFSRGDSRSSTEALPALSSAHFDVLGVEAWVSGGVSLAEKDLFVKRKPLMESAPGPARRSTLDYGTLDLSGTRQLKMLSGANHTLSSETGGAKLVSSAPPGSKMRSPAGEVLPGDVIRTVRNDAGNFSILTSVADKPAGQLHIMGTRNGLNIAWHNRELDLAQLVTTRASRADDFRSALLADHDVDSIVQLAGTDHFAVKLRDSSRWTEVAPETAPSLTVTEGWDGRVAAPSGAKRVVQFRMVEDTAALAKTGTGGGALMLKEHGEPMAAPREIVLARLNPTPPSELLASLHSGDSAVAARKIAADPAKAARELDANLKAELTVVDRLIADGNMIPAGQHLEELRALHGKLPEIQLRLGLALLDRGKPARAAVAAEGMAPTPMRQGNGKAFFDEIRRRIEHQDAAKTPPGLDRWADFAEWRELLASGKGGGKLRIEAEDAGIRLALLDDRPLKQTATTVVDPALIRDAELLLYVQHDLPGMNNVDWNQPLSSALHQLPHGTTPVVLKLENAGVSQFQPDLIYAPDVASNVQLAPNKMTSVRPHSGNAGQRQCSPQGRTGADPDPDCPAAGASPLPVYLVLAQR